MSTVDEYASKARLFVTTTGCEGIVRGHHFEQMLDDTILCNIGHFDTELDMEWLNKNFEKKEQIKPQVAADILKKKNIGTVV